MTYYTAYAIIELLINLTQKGIKMAEEKTIPQKDLPIDEGMNRDDMLSLRYILQHVRGASPSSSAPLTVYTDDPY